MSDTETKTEPLTESKEATVILDGKTVTLAELNEAKAKNPRRIIFDESKNEYESLNNDEKYNVVNIKEWRH